MSTRGLIGFRYGSTDKLAYNHADSFPDELGVRVLEELRAVTDWNAVRERVRTIVRIPDTRLLSEHDEMVRAEIRRHFPDQLQAHDPREYYDLFRPFQGTLTPYLEGRLSFMAVANEFIYDSLHCEWAYIANLDSECFEVWRGCQRHICPTPERYGQEIDRMGYYPCKLLQSYKLRELPKKQVFLGDLTPIRGL